jgi:hypothetical protein
MIVSVLTTSSVMAQTPKATASATPTKAATSSAAVDKDVQNLKDKIATKVAEMRKNQKAVAGTVLEASNNMFKIKTPEDVEYQVKVDESLTKLFKVVGNSKKEVKFQDIKKDTYILVTGPVMDKTINANFVYQDDQYLVKSGKVLEVNKDDNSVKVLTSEKDNYMLDVESSSQLVLMDIKTLSLDKSGFSKIKEGDTVHFVVKKIEVNKEQNHYSIERMLVIPQEYFLK